MDEQIRVGRAVPLNAIETAAAVLGVRREMDGSLQRWSLGDYGSFELDAQFSGLTLSAQTRRGHQCIQTSGRLWHPTGMAVAPVVVSLESSLAPPTQLTLTTTTLPGAFAHDLDGLRALACAALEELSEELMYHAARTRTGAHRD